MEWLIIVQYLPDTLIKLQYQPTTMALVQLDNHQDMKDCSRTENSRGSKKLNFEKRKDWYLHPVRGREKMSNLLHSSRKLGLQMGYLQDNNKLNHKILF